VRNHRTMSTEAPVAGIFRTKWRLGMLGTAAPVFPGFEVDILDRVPDDEKPDAVWHRERARAILRAHPEVKDLFGNTPSTAVLRRVADRHRADGQPFPLVGGADRGLYLWRVDQYLPFSTRPRLRSRQRL